MEISLKAKRLIESKTIALGTYGSKGPNVTPVSCCKVINNKIIITDNYLGSTKDNIIENSKLAIAVWDDTILNKEYGYKLYGKAEYFSKGKWIEFVKNLKENHKMPCRGAIVFTPRVIIEM